MEMSGALMSESTIVISTVLHRSKSLKALLDNCRVLPVIICVHLYI